MSPTDPHSGHVKGYAMESREAADALRIAAEEVRGIDRDKAILSTTHGHNHVLYVLDKDLTANLTAIQKVVLAYGGSPAFGGYVTSQQVKIFTD